MIANATMPRSKSCWAARWRASSVRNRAIPSSSSAQPFTVRGILSTGGDEEDRAFVRLEVLQRLVNRPGQVDAVQVGALTKPEDDFARKDPAHA